MLLFGQTKPANFYSEKQNMFRENENKWLLPSMMVGSSQQFFSFFFRSKFNGWLFDSYWVAHTNDYGKTWHSSCVFCVLLATMFDVKREKNVQTILTTNIRIDQYTHVVCHRENVLFSKFRCFVSPQDAISWTCAPCVNHLCHHLEIRFRRGKHFFFRFRHFPFQKVSNFILEKIEFDFESPVTGGR